MRTRSPDAIRFAETLMSSQTSGHPLLMIVAINTVTMADGAEALADFKGRERVSTVEVGPLKQEHRSTLVRTLLGLEPTLAALVERRSSGNPSSLSSWSVTGSRRHAGARSGGLHASTGRSP